MPAPPSAGDPSRDPAPAPAPARRRASRLRKAALQGLAVLGVLAALEGGLRLAGVRPAARDPYQGFSGFRPLFVDDLDGTHKVTAPDKRPWFNVQRFPSPKPEGTFRIFTLGGSTTYGRPYDDATSFSGWLRELLPAADDTRRWEVINAGGISYASYRVAVILDEVLAEQPDLVILYTGHNEFLEQRTYGDLAGGAGLAGLGALASRSALFEAARHLLGRSDADGGTGGSVAAAAPGVGVEVSTRLDDVLGPEAFARDDAWRDAVVAHFRHNLRGMIDAAADAGVPLLLVVPASELKDCPPFKSEPDTVEGVQPGGPDSRDAAALYARGVQHLAAGRHAEALAALTRARDEDVCPLRAPTAVVEAVRGVAAERGVPVVDFAALLEQRMEADHGHAIVGAEWFLDHVHPTIEGHGLLARALVGAMAGRSLLMVGNHFDDVSVPAVRRSIEARVTPEKQGFAYRNLAKVLGWSGQWERAEGYAALAELALGDGDAETHFLRGNNARALGDLAGAADRYAAAVAIDPGYAEAWFNLADARLGLGRESEALPAAERAAALLPDNAGAGELLGLARLRSGDPGGAVPPLRRATELAPDDPSPWNNLGLAWLALQRPQEARAAFARAVAADDGYVRGRYNLALVLLMLDEQDAARAELSRVVQLDPSHERARERLAALTPAAGDG